MLALENKAAVTASASFHTVLLLDMTNQASAVLLKLSFVNRLFRFTAGLHLDIYKFSKVHLPGSQIVIASSAVVKNLDMWSHYKGCF